MIFILNSNFYLLDSTMSNYMRDVRFLSFFTMKIKSKHIFLQDLTRNEKIQQAKRMINENKYALDAWAILIQDAQVRSHRFSNEKMKISTIFRFRKRKSVIREIFTKVSSHNFRRVENFGNFTSNRR